MPDIAYQKQVLHNARARSATNFYYIAGLTLVSTIFSLSKGGGYESAAGLGIVEVVQDISPSVNVAIGFSVLMAAIFAAFGFFARSGNEIIFIVGIGLYALDTLLLAHFQDWLGVAVHAYILYRLYSGLQYSLAHKKLVVQEEEQLRQQRIANASSGEPKSASAD